MKTTAERSLTIGISSGLSNRLRALVSGLTMAEASGREFTFLWAISNACGADFSTLFANDWPVPTASLAQVEALERPRRMPDVLACSAPHVAFAAYYWLIQPTCYPRHAALVPRCQEIFQALQPIKVIDAQVSEFRERHFSRRMIGVHLRRGDFVFSRRTIAHNLTSSFRAVDRLLRQLPDAGILLCSDDGAASPSRRSGVALGVHHAYLQRYGSRVVWRTAQSLDRAEPQAVQDALVDLWLLRSTDAFVGTVNSSFSELAAYGRSVPTVWAGPDDRRYQAMEFALIKTGLARWMVWDARRRYGRDLLLVEILRRYRGKVRSVLSQGTRRLTS